MHACLGYQPLGWPSALNRSLFSLGRVQDNVDVRRQGKLEVSPQKHHSDKPESLAIFCLVSYYMSAILGQFVSLSFVKLPHHAYYQSRYIIFIAGPNVIGSYAATERPDSHTVRESLLSS